jgi:hypothetical protein
MITIFGFKNLLELVDSISGVLADVCGGVEEWCGFRI